MTEDVRRYLDAVAVELSDLPPDDRGELLADVEEHLTEVAAEHKGALEDFLGDPSSYAAELRSSAGFPLRTALMTSQDKGSWRLLLDRVVSDKQVRRLRAFLTEVEPGWWVLRGYLAVVLVGDMSRADFPFPRVNGNQFLGLLAVGLAIWASVSLGRFARRHRSVAAVSMLASGSSRSP